jgi:hypothetical protein
MLIVRTACSCASACGGNKTRETLRSVEVMAGEEGWSPSDGEVVSPNLNELDSASLHHWWTANLSEMVKPAIDGEETNVCIRRATRGHWRERATTEHIRYPGDPFRSVASAVETTQEHRGRHNPMTLRQRKSDWLVRAKKRGNACGAKRPDRCCVSKREGGAA